MYQRVLNLSSTNTSHNLSYLQYKPQNNPHFMGNCTSQRMESSKNKSNHSITVATLNYGGILNSPFQFYSNEQAQEKLISQHFKELIPEYYPDFNQKTFSWKIGKIDQKIQKQRYTPIYNPTAGIENGKLISAQLFKQKWSTNFENALPKVKLQKQPTEQEIQCMKTFDLICYHALLRHVYKIKSITDVENKDAHEYSKLLERFFARSYLDEDKKLKMLGDLIQSEQGFTDVFFFQEPTPPLVECLKKNGKFKVFEGSKDNSIIAVSNSSKFGANAQSFQSIKKTGKISHENAQKIEANPQTRIVFCDDIILICVHLSSKAEKNKKELEELRAGINILREAFPNHEFVIGGDTNAFIKQDQIQDQNVAKRIQIFPNNPKDITTCKTRTCVQPQFNKAQKMADDCKDQLMSTLTMEDCHVITIDRKAYKTAINLPTQFHPFDHMLVYVSLSLSKPEKK